MCADFKTTAPLASDLCIHKLQELWTGSSRRVHASRVFHGHLVSHAARCQLQSPCTHPCACCSWHRIPAGCHHSIALPPLETHRCAGQPARHRRSGLQLQRVWACCVTTLRHCMAGRSCAACACPQQLSCVRIAFESLLLDARRTMGCRHNTKRAHLTLLLLLKRQQRALRQAWARRTWRSLLALHRCCPPLLLRLQAAG